MEKMYSDDERGKFDLAALVVSKREREREREKKTKRDEEEIY
jgi:type II secretory pathway component PulK